MALKPRIASDVIAAVSVAALLTVTAELVGDTSFGILVSVLVFLLLAFAMCRSPLRHTMLTLTFFVFALPNPAEGLPSLWIPPFYKVGAILLNHLNTVDRSLGFLAAVPASGFDLMMGLMVLIILARRASGSKLDTAGRIPTPKPLVQMALLAIGTALFSWLSGLLRGGDFTMSLWQLTAVIYLPLIFMFFHVSLRGPKDHLNLAKVLIGAALYKCCLALYVVNTVTVPMDPETGSTRPVYGTSHNDSMLFSTAFVLVLALFLEKTSRRAKWIGALCLPLLVAGTMANNRRLAWVQVGLVFLTVYFVSRETPLKRKVRRTLLALSPVFVFYVAAGWSSEFGKLFKPVRLIRSIVDAKSDGSSLWREMENVNIIATFRHNTIFGTGFGHPYEEVVVLPAVDYALERYTPHNSLLGVWCYGGLIGYAGLTMLWMGGVYFAMRSYYKSSVPEERVAALVSFGVVLIYLLQSWGDLGLGSFTGMFLMGNALAVAGKLAASNGEWSQSRKNQSTVKPQASPDARGVGSAATP